MRQTCKGKQWHFGMKRYVGTDRGVVHTFTATHAAAPDTSQMLVPLHGQASAVYGDRAYWKTQHQQAFEQHGVRYRVNRRGTSQAPLSDHWRWINRN